MVRAELRHKYILLGHCDVDVCAIGVDSEAEHVNSPDSRRRVGNIALHRHMFSMTKRAGIKPHQATTISPASFRFSLFAFPHMFHAVLGVAVHRHALRLTIIRPYGAPWIAREYKALNNL